MLARVEARKHRSVRRDGPLCRGICMPKKCCVGGKFIKATRRLLFISIARQSINTLSVKNEEHGIKAWSQNASPFSSTAFLMLACNRVITRI